jgi:ribonuclease I
MCSAAKNNKNKNGSIHICHSKFVISDRLIDEAVPIIANRSPPRAIGIGCARNRLTEVRLCLSKDLQFRDCPAIAKRSCRRDQLVMPPTRGE